MGVTAYDFEGFRLDPAERRLLREGRVIEVSGRYFDALELLVREQGSLVTKDRFMDEVWRGIPVTDEALTQCVRSLRKALGDEAGRPRFIETVPKHGYRFIAPVDATVGATRSAGVARTDALPAGLMLALAGTAGAGGAGLAGGLFYGFAASQAAGGGAASVLIVVLMLTVAIALLGGIGVSAGIAAARAFRGPSAAATVAGGAAGGLVVGALFRLFGLDALDLLFGSAPDGITGAGEGLLLGAATGLGVWLALRGHGSRGLMRRMLTAGWLGAIAGGAIVALGGRLLGGSLALLASDFPASRLRLDAIGRMFGEDGFGPLAQLVSGAAEGALFAACIAGGAVLGMTRFVREPERETLSA